MSVRVPNLLEEQLGALRHEPTEKRILRDSAEITGRIAFFNERVDIFVDGELQERPITPWSRRQREG